jgi:hypothetical protein
MLSITGNNKNIGKPTGKNQNCIKQFYHSKSYSVHQIKELIREKA